MMLSNAYVDIYTAMTLQRRTAEGLIQIVRTLRAEASFRRILVEARRDGLVMWHRTLRKYLDHLVLGGVLEKRLRDVGSVYPMELYRVKSTRARIHVGLSVLQLHGLNWDIGSQDLMEVSTDLSALVRAKPTLVGSRHILAGCLEDCLAYEFLEDTRAQRGTLELLVGLMSTKRLDLAYLFERADQIGVGRFLRAVFRIVRETFSSAETEADARVFLATRQVFLKLARQYSYSGTIGRVDERGRGTIGLHLARGLSALSVVNAAGKQLGILG